MTNSHDLRRYMNAVVEAQTDNLLDRELLGSIIQVAPEDDFGVTLWFMKFADGTWRRVTNFTYYRGHPQCDYDGGAPIDQDVLHAALAANRVSRPVEGIKPGDRIKASAQMHALPDGAVIVNPQIGSVYHKRAGAFFADNGQELPAHVFDHDNAQWR